MQKNVDYKGIVWIAIAYIGALSTAYAVIQVLGSYYPIINTFVADIAATLVIFVFGRIFKNASFYDPYWSVAPIIIAFYWAFGLMRDYPLNAQQIIVLILVSLWGLRLTYNWASQWRGLKHEDWRYCEYRIKSGNMFWLVELVGIELMPTILVFLGCLSLYPILTTESVGFGPFTVLGILVTLAAIIIESTADWQLTRFIANKPAEGSVINSGLWKYSRHPNYLGEILFWWGIWIFVLGMQPRNWLAVVGPLAITGLFVFVSIPMMEKRNLLRRLTYSEHQKKVSVLVPWFKSK
jgi:steroid 5-alpha reductase family enzyme